MKKSVYLIIFMLVLFLAIDVYVSAGQETSLETGDRNVAFSNNYRGFCLDPHLKGAYTNDVFTPASDTSAATSNRDNSDVSHSLKVLFTQCFEDLFVSDGNGGYQVEDTNLIQAIVWHFTDNQYVWGESARLTNLVKAYDGAAIPDNGYTLELDNGDVITFYFMVMVPQNSDQQTFFAYKIEVNERTTHEHEWSNEWSTDGNNHWHECICGEKKDEGSHSGGEANCIEQAKCEICEKPYGEVNKKNHTGETEIRNYQPATQAAPGYTGDTHCKDCGERLLEGEEIPKLHTHDYSDKWSTDGNKHWHECTCGDKKDEGSHSGGEANCIEQAKCEICEKPYGEVNKKNHTGNTEIINYQPATQAAPGYTGDTHCKDCGEKLLEGEEIPKLHTHEYGEKWSTDGNNHWHECICGEKKDEGSHSGGEANCIEQAKCEICEKPYGEVNKKNHTGETEIRNYKPATETEPGYTGDTHCKDCGEKLLEGEEIPKLHTHDYSGEWSTDENNHWHECACGEKKDEGKHTYTDEICSVCKKVNSNGAVKSPKTSDSFNSCLWFMLLLLNIGGLIGTLLARKNCRI